ncbi:hypothetical protein JVU11DRAFT_2506 [Chiua virens]|nr:hypothetical protein JVU11DRAFT_2506 [Chiua virens]
MLPRFIIHVRELYRRDVHRRQQGIDSSFRVMSTMAFADVVSQGRIEGDADGSEVIPLVEAGDGACQVRLVACAESRGSRQRQNVLCRSEKMGCHISLEVRGLRCLHWCIGVSDKDMIED